MSTVADTMSTVGRYHEYTRGFSVHWVDILSTPRAYNDECGGDHEYTERCSVHRRIP